MDYRTQNTIPPKKGSPLKIILIVIAAVVVLSVVGIVAALTLGKGSDSKKDKKADKTSEDSTDYEDDDSEDDDSEDADDEDSEANDGLGKISNVPVLGTELQDYMLWGWYLPTIDGEYFDFKEDDCRKFCDAAGMTKITKISTYGEEEIDSSALPVYIRIGRPIDIGITVPDMHESDPSKGYMFAGYPKEEELEELRQDYVKTFGEDGIKYYQNFLKYLDTTFAEVMFCDENGYINWIFRTVVKVEGNTVSLVYFTRDNQTSEITEEGTLLSYDAYFDGITMVLNSDGNEIRYSPYDHTEKTDWYSNSGYAKNDDEAYHNIIRIFYYEDKETGKDPYGCFIECNNGDKPVNPDMEFNDDGTFTISWEEVSRQKGDDIYDRENVSAPYSFSGEYLWGYDWGIVLNIDGQIYRYQSAKEEYQASVIDIEEDVRDEEVADLIMTQTTINYQLIEELEAEGIDAETDSKGRIVIGTNVLFAVDSDEISETGSTELDRFLAVYARVILPYIEAGSVSYVEVEGHTDTDGTYDYNLDLSQRRAESVANYALEVQPELGANMQAQGYSFSDPVLDESGNVDKDASRRVVFKIVLNK